MSDFSTGWHWFIAAMTVAGIIACTALLWLVGRKKVVSLENGQEVTTGHVWDEDLRELNNPMPRWWVGLFYLTIIFSVAYVVLYPGLGRFTGQWGWSQVSQYEDEVRRLDVQVKPLYDAFAAQTVPQLAGDARAMAVGERLFLNNCSQCHGSDARGGRHFPNLTDGDWLYGGTPDAIKTTLTQGRHGQMPPMAAAVGGAADVDNLVQYVLSLSGTATDPLKANLGKSKFTACAACHGADGKGNPAIGAPNLTDKVWLHGSGAANVARAIREGFSNVMPAQSPKMSAEQIHVLAAYVWGMSNRPEPAGAAQAASAAAGAQADSAAAAREVRP